ncbi:MAG: SPOR domain-containing protein [Bacteroidales bacterium]|jgi:hypothetical protein|nr:SPOR domain-containing protein [Bacteroidales bacterium]
MRKITHTFVFFIILFCIIPLQGQEMVISATTDTSTNEITTFITLIDIPEGGRVRFQQRLLPHTKLTLPPSEFSLWDTTNNIFTLITPKYPHSDTLSFVFICKTDSFPDIITWGESALMFENKNRIVEKINIPAKNYIIRQNNIPVDSLIAGFYYIQILASKTVQSKNDIAKLIHLQNDHFTLEEKTEKYYKYFIGHFSSRQQASDYLKYYKQYTPDAFIIQF